MRTIRSTLACSTPCLLLALSIGCDTERTIDDELMGPEQHSEVEVFEAPEGDELEPGDDPGDEPQGDPGDEPQGDPGDDPPDGAAVVTDVIQDCNTDAGYEITSWRTEAPAEPRLWVGGVYETRSDHSHGHHPTGIGEISWTIPGSNVLVLSAYEPTDWTITYEGDGRLEQVIAIGYHLQQIDAPLGVSVETYSYDQGNFLTACGYALPSDSMGCETEELIAHAEDLTGLSLHGYDGCYHATRFLYDE